MAECQKQFPIKSTKTNFESWIEYLETIQKMSVCIFSHINANIYATRLASDQNGTQIFIRYCLYEIYCFDSLINSQKMHLFII